LYKVTKQKDKLQNMSSILAITNLSKSFTNGDNVLTILEDINISIEEKETFSIVGPSGSGKTTLLGLCAGLDDTSSGKVELCGVDLGQLNEDERAILRNKKVGFIFQDFQLLPSLTALDKGIVPLELQGEKNANQIGKDLLEKVGLENRMNHYPSQLSGGEQQRVAIARAFSNQPTILFADEPTGNLDEESGETVVNLLLNLNKEAGTTLVIVTHDLELAQKTQRRIILKGGTIYHEEIEAAENEQI
jgi:putative ABC transport system ATP-binding protein